MRRTDNGGYRWIFSGIDGQSEGCEDIHRVNTPPHSSASCNHHAPRHATHTLTLDLLLRRHRPVRRPAHSVQILQLQVCRSRLALGWLRWARQIGHVLCEWVREVSEKVSANTKGRTPRTGYRLSAFSNPARSAIVKLPIGIADLPLFPPPRPPPRPPRDIFERSVRGGKVELF